MIRCAKEGGKVCLSGWGSKEETHAFSVFPEAMRRCGLDKKYRYAQSAARKHELAGIIPPPSSSGNEHKRSRKRYSGIKITPNFYCPTTRISSNKYYLRSLMADAGLVDISIKAVTNELQLDSAESYWNRFVLASPNLKRFVEHCLDEQEMLQLKDAVSAILHEESSSHGDNAGIVLKASAYIAVGTKCSRKKCAKSKSKKK